MARPSRRSSSSSRRSGSARRSRQEEPEETGRRGRRSAPAKSGPNPVTLILGALVLVLILGAIAAVNSGDDKPQGEAVRLGAVEKTAAPKPGGPVTKPLEPLSAEEQKWIEGLFEEAEPYMEEFRKYLASGMVRKGDGDNQGANDEWVKAKKAYQHAIGIVAEAMEDFDRFPYERQDKFMARWVSQMADWQKEYRNLPKVDVR